MNIMPHGEPFSIFRNSAVLSAPRVAGCSLGFSAIYFPSIVLISILIGGCVAEEKQPNLLFDAGPMTDAQYLKADKECQFEAEKAVTPIRPSPVAGERFRKIYILCVEAKGIKFLGTSDKVKL